MQTTPESDGHILLVDDDNSVRAFIAASLKAAGYRFFQAASGPEALLLFQAHFDEIELVLTDIVMPGMFGDELAMKLVELKPTIKIILMSGNPPGALETEIHIEPGVNFLQKPFLVQDLRECLAHHF